jgi:hypothetical protein
MEPPTDDGIEPPTDDGIEPPTELWDICRTWTA